MRFWFVRSSDVPLHEQIVTQVRLGVLSGELGAGERLPSTRELARRFGIHPNTVSAAYRELHKEGWTTLKRGSSMFVRDQAVVSGGGSLDGLIESVVRAAGAAGVSRGELRERFLRVLDGPGRQRLMLVEPDAELRAIVVWELRSGLGVDVEACEAPAVDASESDLIYLVLPSKAAGVRSTVGVEGRVCVLQIRPIAGTFAMHLPRSREGLIGIVSRWAQFLDVAKTMLVGAGFGSEALVLRDAREAGWESGLEQMDAVICDSLMAGRLAGYRRVIAFSLLAEESLAEVRGLIVADKKVS